MILPSIDFLSLTYKIYQSLGDGSDVLLIFLEAAKAFDKVHHTGLCLLHKLQSFRITDDLLDWPRRYTDRKQRVVLIGGASEWKCIDAGFLRVQY